MMRAAATRKGAERQALRRRIRQLYTAFNRGKWEECFSLIDPTLRDQRKVDEAVYGDLMQAFREVYGEIKLWHIRISLHLDERKSKQESRPFAYVYVVWQDAAHGFHMFRERWVKQAGHWFTRVVGLVPNQQGSVLNGN